MTGTIALVSNTAWSVANFRAGLIKALQDAGYRVLVAAPEDEYARRLVESGCRYVAIPMNNKGTNPIADLVLTWRLWSMLRRERPLCALTYTPKPNIYVSLAARPSRIPVIANIAGLGSAFVDRRWLTAVVRRLYRFALRSPRRVFFQNRDDRAYFVREGLVDESRSALLPGSGVDTRWFAPRSADASAAGALRFLLFGRLIAEKGVREYVQAARSLLARGVAAEFHILGFLEVPNPSAILRREVAAWVAEGIVHFHEPTTDVRPQIARADCIVLPSYYREGTPRSLLEAASMGKPVITTDAPGCRDAVVDGESGFLVRPRDAVDLAEKMERIVGLPAAERRDMGRRGREMMLREFDERIVIERYLREIADATLAR
jgi:glycosyltransferase involved in cell wall biosynthesis